MRSELPVYKGRLRMRRSTGTRETCRLSVPVKKFPILEDTRDDGEDSHAVRSQESVGALSGFSGQLHYIKPRLPDVRDRAGRAIGVEIEDQILAGIVTRPCR